LRGGTDVEPGAPNSRRSPVRWNGCSGAESMSQTADHDLGPLRARAFFKSSRLIVEILGTHDGTSGRLGARQCDRRLVRPHAYPMGLASTILELSAAAAFQHSEYSRRP
jgi:hypothetical protein